MEHGYTYRDVLSASERVNWRVEELIGDGKEFDFSKRFMPEALARVEPLGFLTPREKCVLNQIRANAYLCIFGLVEEFILPFVMDHARPQLQGDDHRVRALLQFAGEEAKHIHLFKCFRETFERGFGTSCDVIGPPDAIARAVLAHHPLAVALVILHIEWMTQAHYVESVKDDRSIDPQFKSLLKHHWMEEAQHAKLDTMMVEALTESCTDAEIDQAVGEYFEIGMFLDQGLEQQMKLDLEAFERATGRAVEGDERAQFEAVQRQANRWTYLGSGMTHPKVLAVFDNLSADARKKLEEVAPAFC